MALVAFAVVSVLALTGLETGAGASVPPPSSVPSAPDVATLRSEQQAVVTRDHDAAVNAARSTVDQLTSLVGTDTASLAAAQQARAAAQSSLSTAQVRLGSDQDALARTLAALSADGARLNADHTALAALAVGLYTGQITNPQPTSLHALEAEQDQIISYAETQVVAGVVDGHLHADLAARDADDHQRSALGSAMGGDQRAVAAAQQSQTAAANRVAAATSALQSDQDHVAAARTRLATEEQDEAAARAAVAGPAAPSGLTIVGGSALDANQLAGWYSAEGYFDLTSTPIDQLAAWYIQAGDQEGVRGDVAFAQAVLETGGFSSADSVQLNNYAGIGHCDSCDSGWSFPSSSNGVVGQLQLLRIFADGSLPTPPPPVLPALTSDKQARRACCSTWESLTGVWATDPAYGGQILGIYQQMLTYALSPRSPT